MKIKNLLFDLDGTITDPKVGITESVRYALKELGIKDIPEQGDLLWFIGPPLHESFSVILKTDKKEIVDEAVRLYRVNYNRKGIFQFKLYNKIVETIKILNSDFNVYIATSKPKVMADIIFEHLSISHLFKGVYGSELDGTRTKKGEVITFLLDNEKLLADETIMIGDRKHDIIGAKENNMLSCGVIYGYGSKKELLEAGADFVVKRPEEIPTLLF